MDVSSVSPALSEFSCYEGKESRDKSVRFAFKILTRFHSEKFKIKAGYFFTSLNLPSLCQSLASSFVCLLSNFCHHYYFLLTSLSIVQMSLKS